MVHKQTFSMLFLLGIITLLGVVVFRPSFNTSLYGDEWKIFWLGKSAINGTGTILPKEVGDWSYISEIVVFELMSKIFGYTSLPYYVLSFLLRLVAAFTLFWFLRRRKLSKSTAFLGSLLFMLSPIGLETTVWTRNFDSYLGIVFLLLMIDLTFNIKGIKNSLLLAISFIIVLIVNTLRSPGFLITICIILFARVLSDDTTTNKNLKRILLVTILTLVGIFYLFANSNLFGGQPQGIQTSNFPFKLFINSFLGNIGRSTVPYLPNELHPFLIISGMFLFWKKEYFFRRNRLSKMLGLIEITIIIYIGHQISQRKADFSNSFLIGGFFFSNLIIASVMDYFQKNKEEFVNTITVLALSFSFILVPAIRQPYFQADSIHRYLIHTALVIPIICAFSIENFINLGSKIKLTVSMFAFTILLLSFTQLSVEYLTSQELDHSTYYTQTVWAKLKTYLDKYNLKKNKVEIIFSTDPNSYPEVNSAVHFGFMYHTALIYEIWTNDLLPTDYLVWNKEMLDKQIKEIFNSTGNKMIIEIIGSQVREVPFPTSINPKAKP